MGCETATYPASFRRGFLIVREKCYFWVESVNFTQRMFFMDRRSARTIESGWCVLVIEIDESDDISGSLGWYGEEVGGVG